MNLKSQLKVKSLLLFKNVYPSRCRLHNYDCLLETIKIDQILSRFSTNKFLRLEEKGDNLYCFTCN